MSAEPSDLRAAGRDLWQRMHGGLADELEFGPHELEVLLRACRSADREEDLRLALLIDGVLSKGSTGQTTLHPAMVELRLLELQTAGLLQRVSLENTGGVIRTPTAERAQKAAHARWDRKRGNDLAARRRAG
jgi:hypothetical protein